ncbi:MAG TPA: SUMF1/EgtB/PvdO family nonheme iron enzyme [Anaerolineales bacterium]|nr:SUMF1/EgtB/PvdO family nonheme iron enzyme [Anaerolineales bacterium]
MSTFISYSRVNSAFVVRLAKDLKTAGFDVWLDQLDIPKGARWDDEIEAAVERSSTFMIVLAPESIESQNVKDELSYAIDAGKHLLPVVIRPCKIPLRLRRFQYVDFTDKPYKDSLSDIKHLLSNTQQIPRAPVEKPIFEKDDAVPLVKGPLIPRVSPAQPGPYQEFRPEGESRLRKFALPVVLGLVAMATIAVLSVYAARSNRAAPVAPLLLTSTPTAEEILPTDGPTATPVPPPVQITDPRGAVPMRLVSAGEFIMGNNDGSPDEGPEQPVYVDSFYIDTYEVTNALYRVCADAGACKSPTRINSVTHVGYYSRSEFDDYPVVYVDWYMANSFCAWRGARLPTEAEWEKAARGTEGRTYPWGEEISGTEANYAGSQKDTTSVFEFAHGMSPYGVHNMAGNVYEWVNSLFVAYPYSAMDGREDPNVNGARVIRGGSWLKSNGENQLRTSHRQRADPTLAAEYIGFRCVHPLDFLIPDTGGPTATPRNGSTATSMAATSQVRKTRESNGLLPSLLLTVQASAVPTSGPTLPQAVNATKTTVSPADPPVVVTDPPVVVTDPPVVVTDPPVVVTDPPVVVTDPPVVVTDPPVVVTDPPVKEELVPTDPAAVP